MAEIGQLNIETPEQVSLQFNLAGAGSRFMAVAVDHALQGIVIVFVALILGITFSFASARANLWGVAFFLLFIFVVDWGYFAAFETLWNGQTPGKKLVNIRVIRADGRPIAVFEAMTRNLIRIIDLLPGLYLTGLVCMVVDSRSRRLGDMAAGTVVVHERVPEDVPVVLAPRTPTVGYDIHSLTTDDLVLIETFLSRRSSLGYQARDKIALNLATSIRTKIGLTRAEAPNDEKFLEAVAKGLRDNAAFLKK